MTIQPSPTTADSSSVKKILTDTILPAVTEKTLTNTESLALIKDSVSTIKKSALRFLSGTALSRVTGLIRDMILASCFGTGSALAAFFVAYRLAHVCRRLFGEGALQSAFIPVFEEMRKGEPARAFRFFRDMTALLTVFLTFLIITTMAVLFGSLYFIDWSPGNREIVKLMIIMMPSLLPICLFGINSGLLQCQKHYFTAGIAPAFFNLSIIITCFFLQGTNAYEAMPYIAAAVVLACFMQWLVTLGPTFRHIKAQMSIKLWESISFNSSDLKRLAKPLSLGLLGVGASQINNAVDALFARYADDQGPAQLWYGLRLLQLPLALFGIAISGALLPPLSRAIQAGKKAEYLHFLDFALRRVAAFLIPCTVLLYVLGTPLMNLIYGRGDFQADSVYTSTSCLHGYALGLLPMGLVIVMAPAFYAHNNFKIPTLGAILCLVVNLVLNAFMIYVLHWKAMSVALATSISSWANILFLYYYLVKHSGKLLSEDGAQESFKVISVSIFAGAITWFFQTRFMLPASLFNLNTNYSSQLPTALMDQITAFAIPFGVFFGFLLLFAWIVKAEDLLGLFKKTKPPIVGPSQENPLAAD